MSLSVLIVFLAVALAGVAISVQAPINAMLGRALGDPILAAAVSFGIGFLALAILATLRGALPQLAAGRGVPLWVWSAGLFGAYYVWASIWAVSSIGVLSLVAALIFGQLTGALALDAIGAFGMATRPIDATRLAAVALVGAGLVLSRF